MRKWIITTLALMLIPALITCLRDKGNDLPLSTLKVTSGNLYHLDLFSSEMNETIKVDVWTPEGYDDRNTYPVIYMHDGQNLFDASSTWNHQAWEIDSVAGPLMASGELPQAIIVGIYSTDSTRLGDLMPEKPLEYLQNDTIRDFIAKMCRDNYRADEYLAFITNTLRQVINTKFATDTTTTATAVMGSSMGGLISIYAMCEYPDLFGTAACLSTHWTGALGGNEDFPAAMQRYLTEKLPRDTIHRLYLDNGTCPYDSVYIPYFQRMGNLANSLGYTGKRFKHWIFPGHSHNEASWASRVEIPLKFILKQD